MAAFEIKIPQGGIDGVLPAAEEFYSFDRGLTRNPSFKVLSASFGDGYEQRIGDGINSKKEIIQASFKTRLAEEINTLAAYFDALKGVTPIDIYIANNNEDETIKVVCSNYSITYGHTTVHSLMAEFKRVYEP